MELRDFLEVCDPWVFVTVQGVAYGPACKLYAKLTPYDLRRSVLQVSAEGSELRCVVSRS